MTELNTLDVEKELAAFEAAERERLGLNGKQHWTDAMVDPMFTAKERPNTTLLIGGLTMAHDYLVEGALKGLGYVVRALDCPDNESLRFGKEFGNKAQCNPTHFTVGNLVKELCRLRDQEGLSSDEIIKRYIFMTAGACGPCRFGMYITEYRKALRDAGFDGFRVLLFQQTGGFKQATGEELGLVLDPPFFIAIAKALLAGDVINALSYRIRPYELESGSTDRAVQAVKDEVYKALSERTNILRALLRGRAIFAGVAVDRTRLKTKVSVLGEFWAMTTEGDGNYHLQRFIEAEGGECEIQLIANLLLYNLWEGRHDTLARAKLKGTDTGNFGLEGQDVGLKMAGLWVGEFLLRATFQTFAHALGLYRHKLPDMNEVAKVGHSHYNVELRGGEGHMEVAKLILNVVHQKSHMTISVKPFGCMPSSGVSDGVQSVITERFPDAIFCAVETSGDGAVNFYSRVQMYLFKARQRAQKEMDETLAQHGVTREDVQRFLNESLWGRALYGRTLYRAPHKVAGTAADVIHQVAPLVGKSPAKQALIQAQRLAMSGKELATETLPKKAKTVAHVSQYLPAIVRWAAVELKDALPSAAGTLEPARALESVKASLTLQGAHELWNRMLDGLVKPTAEQQDAITAAEQLAAASGPASHTSNGSRTTDGARRLPLAGDAPNVASPAAA